MPTIWKTLNKSLSVTEVFSEKNDGTESLTGVGGSASKRYPWPYAVGNPNLTNILGGLNILPLGQAVLNKTYSFIEKFVGSPNELSDKKFTPFMFAALIDDPTSAKLLKISGADASWINDDNKNAIDIACEQNSEDFLKIFHDDPLIKEENVTEFNGINLEAWRRDIGQFCLNHQEKFESTLPNLIPTTVVPHSTTGVTEVAPVSLDQGGNLDNNLVPLDALSAGIVGLVGLGALACTGYSYFSRRAKQYNQCLVPMKSLPTDRCMI